MHALAALRAAVLLGAVAQPASAAELVTARPLELVLGPPRGFATAAGVDPTGSRHTEALPPADTARVLWQRQVPGGVASHVLVDAEGRIFLVGTDRVTQLGADGSVQFSQAGDVSGALAAALLGDGTRAILTREGRVLGWSALGAAEFDLPLDAPPPSGASRLYPLPDGGVLVNTGRWLFEIDASRAVVSHAALPASIQQVLLSGGRALAIDEHGRVFEWDRRDPVRPIGAFDNPVEVALLDAEWLVALTSGRRVQRLHRSDGRLQDVLRLDAPGAAPVLGWLAPERWVVMKHDGSWFVAQPDLVAPRASTRRAAPGALAELELLADAQGAVAWWAAGAPLHLETASGVGRELPEVRCTAPESLAPAGEARLVAACSSGVVWLVGPAPSP